MPRTHLQLLMPVTGGKYSPIDTWGEQVSPSSQSSSLEEGQFTRSGATAFRIGLVEGIAQGWLVRVQGQAHRQYRVDGVEYEGAAGLFVTLQCTTNTDPVTLAEIVTIDGDELTIGGRRLVI